MTSRVALGALLLSVSALAERAEEQRAKVQKQLEAEKALFDSLQKKKGDFLATLEFLERLSRDGEQRALSLSRQVQRLSRMAGLAERTERLARAELQARQQRVGPRLQAFYRLTRQDPLNMMVSAESFASMLRRGQAMRTLVRQDLQLLEELGLAARFQRQAAQELTRMRAMAAIQLAAFEQSKLLAEQRKQRFEDMLDWVQAQSVRSSRMLKELQEAERELSTLVEQMKRSGNLGFRGMKGRLPYPTQGLIEVVFGKVVNPRFNTVTVQKGLDFRAPQGTPVVAVAPGKVVYAGWLKGYGNLLIIDHGDGYHSLLGHLSSFNTAVGETVAPGAKVAEVGDTGSLKGAYLYFEIRHQGKAIDPGPWLDEAAGL